jgi:hypothetical protein
LAETAVAKRAVLAYIAPPADADVIPGLRLGTHPRARERVTDDCF